MKLQNLERQLPYGVADLFFEDAARKSKVEAMLRRTFDTWSYSEIESPTFEYFEPLELEASPQVREEIYRFFDRDGRMLALRADPTIPIARIVSTKLTGRLLPLRLCYVTNVFRYEEPKAALRREFTQAGVELIGTDTAAADAEVVALAITALREAGLRDFRIRLGAMNLIRALLDEIPIDAMQMGQLKTALERKSGEQLAGVLNGDPIRPALRHALSELVQLTGDGWVIDRAEERCAVNPDAQAAIAHLRRVYEYLQVMGCADSITLDLGMVRGMAYYTGIVFEGFAPGIGFALMSGGRYDDLLAHFGSDLPAIGFAIGVERTLAALAMQDGIQVDLAPQVVAEMPQDSVTAARIGAARAAGRRVETVLTPLQREELLAHGRSRGAVEAWFADGAAEVLR